MGIGGLYLRFRGKTVGIGPILLGVCTYVSGGLLWVLGVCTYVSGG